MQSILLFGKNFCHFYVTIHQRQSDETQKRKKVKQMQKFERKSHYNVLTKFSLKQFRYKVFYFIFLITVFIMNTKF